MEHLEAGSCRIYRANLRGFLTYLYHERNIIKTDLAPLVVSRRQYAQAKPPNFLRPQEIKKLFAGLTIGNVSDIRTYALVQLAYTMGLRHKEISKISLEDISFSTQQLTVADRKGTNPIKLPVPEHTVKAIAAYLIAARPQSEHRRVFLTLHPPFRPMRSATVGCLCKGRCELIEVRIFGQGRLPFIPTPLLRQPLGSPSPELTDCMAKGLAGFLEQFIFFLDCLPEIHKLTVPVIFRFLKPL